MSLAADTGVWLHDPKHRDLAEAQLGQDESLCMSPEHYRVENECPDAENFESVP